MTDRYNYARRDHGPALRALPSRLVQGLERNHDMSVFTETEALRLTSINTKPKAEPKRKPISIVRITLVVIVLCALAAFAYAAQTVTQIPVKLGRGSVMVITCEGPPPVEKEGTK